jgi:hypothetical protein
VIGEETCAQYIYSTGGSHIALGAGNFFNPFQETDSLSPGPHIWQPGSSWQLAKIPSASCGLFLPLEVAQDVWFLDAGSG